MEYKMYDVVLIDFGTDSLGSEQGGERPAVIIQNDVGNCANQHRQHARLCKPLRRNERIHAQGQLNKNRPDRIDIHVIHGVFNGILAGAKGQKKITIPDQ